MKNLFNICLIVSVLFTACADKKETEKSAFNYPETYRDSTVVDDYHGQKITDYYRWLENDNSDSTKNWVIAQNKLTFDYINKIPSRQKLYDNLKGMWNYESISTPSKHGDYYVYSKNDGVQNQSVYYIKKGMDGEEEILLDPNTLSEDGTVSVSTFSISNDNKYLAYGLSVAGSDWKDFKVMNLETKEIMSDFITWVKFSGVSWYKNGFFYSGYTPQKDENKLTQKNEFAKVFYHELGTEQKEDKIIFEDKEHPLRGFYASVTDDEKYMAISASEGTSGNMIYLKDLTKPNSEFIQVTTDFENDTWLVDNFNDKLLLFTNIDAPNNKVIQLTLDNVAKENWVDFVPEKETKLESISVAGNRIFTTYLHDVSSKIEILNMDGTYHADLKLPGKGICRGVYGKKDENTAFYSFTSYLNPSTSYELNVETLEAKEYFKPAIDFNSEDYISEQVFYTSADGEKIPMFINYHKDTKLDGNAPCLLYAYGGFNISITPSFSVVNAVFMKNGGIYAVANIRGGSEYGEKWHKAGMLHNKQNVFNDFIAAAEYLKANNYTSTEKLALHGRSNGGLLMGAVMTQRPDLAAVVLPGVGVLDMLRYHKFTIGWAWAVEFGSSDNKEQFDNLIKYSPLHNIKETSYPATLVLTGDHDDRVVPAHSFKFISELQHKQKGDKPVMVRIDVNAGHGAGKPKEKSIGEWADIWAFTFHNLNHTIK
ncbi:MAG: S9 family peptidase [Flavobacteriales bacterium]|nr:S9 family peptidase [Flavobacteriales bacterium]MCB9363473.1 S9 family peptidase [Flavobacteriales bacterium]